MFGKTHQMVKRGKGRNGDKYGGPGGVSRRKARKGNVNCGKGET